MGFGLLDRMYDVDEIIKTRGRPNEEERRKLREDALQYQTDGHPWTRKEIVKGTFPPPYENMNGMSIDSLCRHYGSGVNQVIFENRSKITVDIIDAAVWRQMDQDHKFCKETLYDPLAKEEIPFGAFRKKYGIIAEDYAESGGNYSREVKEDMLKKHAKPLKEGKINEAAVKPQQHQVEKKIEKHEPVKLEPILPHTGDKYFLKINRGVISNSAYRFFFKEKGYSVVFEYMWAHIVRKGWVDKPGYPIKEKYYDKGFLAFCSSYRYLGRKCGLDKNYIQKILEEFNNKGIIKLEIIFPEGKKFSQMVAVLGQWKSVGGKIEEKLYRDHIFFPGA